MTFSVVARCEETGMFGVAISTRPMAIGAKCPFAEAGVGALVCQNHGDPRAGSLALNLLRLGYSAPKVLEELIQSDSDIEYRQIAIVDRDGRAAAHTGQNGEEWQGHQVLDNFVSLGNRLTSEKTATAMTESWKTTKGVSLGERLMRCLEAARDAGGQIGGHYSAALKVVNRKSYGWIDLRVDEHDEPIGELRRLLDLYTPLVDYYDLRPANPMLPRDDIWRRQNNIAGGPR